MYYDVLSAKYVDGYKIELTFEDGKVGIVDLQKYVDQGGVFSKLQNMEYFRNFQINKELRIIYWKDQIDIAPETLYSEATGTPLPDWIESISALKKTA